MISLFASTDKQDIKCKCLPFFHISLRSDLEDTENMKLHQTASFLSLLTLASAEYPWPLLCGPKPPTVTPFDPERVRTSYSFYLHLFTLLLLFVSILGTGMFSVMSMELFVSGHNIQIWEMVTSVFGTPSLQRSLEAK